jgi:hypothetical protein
LRSVSAGSAGIEGALQNESWLASPDVEAEPGFIEWVRMRQRFVELVERQSPCSSSEEALNDAWREAGEEIADEVQRSIFVDISAPNMSNALLRGRLVAIDSELTALILDARGERVALRRRRWPTKLLTLGTGVCPEAKWTYRALPDGTARFRLETRLADLGGIPFRLPLEFTAGTPLKRRPTKKGVVVNPPPLLKSAS